MVVRQQEPVKPKILRVHRPVIRERVSTTLGSRGYFLSRYHDALPRLIITY